MKEYVIADTHFNHKNICGEKGFVKTRRRFTSVEEMDQTMIDAWNDKVHEEDVVYFLGDFSLHRKPKDALDLLRQLNGHIEFVKGNHDNTRFRKAIQNDDELSQRITWHEVGTIIKRHDKIVHLTHYPMIIGNRGGRVNLHGHIHDMVRHEPNLLNVGVDSPEIIGHEFGSPISIETCLFFLEAKQQVFDLSEHTYTKHGTIE